MTAQAPDRNLALELVRVTESAAMAAARWMGRGDKNGADGAAVDAMRKILDTVSMDGIVVIGEGEKDDAPMLFNGERIGDGTPPAVRHRRRPDRRHEPHRPRPRQRPLGHRRERAGHDVRPRSVRLHGEDRGRARSPGGVDRHHGLRSSENLHAVAKAKGESVRDLTVVILDRDRHAELIGEVRAAGARVRLISDGDVYGAIATAWPDAGVDVLFGIGGTPEGVIAAAALKCMGGEIQGRLWPRNDEERSRRRTGRLRPRPRPHDRRPRPGDNCFFAATGITDGELLRGVRFDPQGPRTQSLVMRSLSGTVRLVDARHRLDKLQQYASIDYA